MEQKRFFFVVYADYFSDENIKSVYSVTDCFQSRFFWRVSVLIKSYVRVKSYVYYLITNVLYLEFKSC
jgi:hypothetical protein